MCKTLINIQKRSQIGSKDLAFREKTFIFVVSNLYKLAAQKII